MLVLSRDERMTAKGNNNAKAWMYFYLSAILFCAACLFFYLCFFLFMVIGLDQIALLAYVCAFAMGGFLLALSIQLYYRSQLRIERSRQWRSVANRCLILLLASIGYFFAVFG